MITEYLPAILLTLLAVALVIALILFGWRRRVRRQADLPAPTAVPEQLSEPREDFEGTYVVTTRAGDRLDRVAAHGLGVRGNALLSVGADGVAVLREGSPSFFVAASELRQVGTTSNMVGKAVETDGIVVLRYEHGGVGFDTGFRTRYHERKTTLLAAVDALIPAEAGSTSIGKETK